MIIERVKAVVACQFDVQEDEISDSTTFEELGADSYDIADLLKALSEEFDCTIPLLCADTVKTVGDAADCVKNSLR
jgi:acyl carrier protein